MGGAGGGAPFQRLLLRLTHVFFLQFFARHGLRAAEGPPLFTVPLVSLLVLICGWGAYALFSRVPGVRRWLI